MPIIIPDAPFLPLLLPLCNYTQFSPISFLFLPYSFTISPFFSPLFTVSPLYKISDEWLNTKQVSYMASLTGKRSLHSSDYFWGKEPEDNFVLTGNVVLLIFNSEVRYDDKHETEEKDDVLWGWQVDGRPRPGVEWVGPVASLASPCILLSRRYLEI
jgi:hypothetical protein